ncbi:phage tail domain-containing protein [Lysinibacillus sp. FSL M8-0355]|uniref:phage tail domain-containing protein n=1 Tax=Lysinibacillus sp. FSL M8-0355 TaxID=2921719 RepID=UPI0030FA4E55
MQIVTFMNELNEMIDFDINSSFILSKIDGTGSVAANHRTSNIPSTHGSQRTLSTLNPRYLTLHGSLIASNRSELALLKEQLCEVFNPSLKDGKLRYDAGAGIKFVYAIAEEMPIFSGYIGNSVNFIINLVANNPFWHDIEFYEHTFTTPYQSLFTFPQSTPTQMGLHTDTQTFFNKGNERTPLILEFEGGIKNVKFINKTNGEWIEFRKKLNSNEKLIINSTTGQKEVSITNTKGEQKQGYGLLTFDCSTYIHLEKGNNVIQFIGETDSKKGLVKLKWETNYLGV